MALNMQDLQTKLRNRGQGGANDGANYPFWTIPDNTQAVVRFLPDGNEANDYFWVDKTVIKLPFAGIKGGKDEETTVTVPTMSQFGKTCMILAEAAALFRESDDLKKEGDLEQSEIVRNRARSYYKKNTAIYQGFVRDNPLQEKSPPENPIRRFIINKQIHNKIVDSITNARFKELPCDYNAGRDFWINKRRQGQWPNYSDSTWDLEGSSPLTDEELAAIDKFGLQDLSKFLPKEPTAEEQTAIMEMFEASKAGEEYDPARWAHFYRPFGVSKPDAAKTVHAAPKTDVGSADVASDAPAEAADTADVSDASDASAAETDVAEAPAPAPAKSTKAATAAKAPAKSAAKAPAKSTAKATADAKAADEGDSGNAARNILQRLEAEGAEAA